MPERLVVHDPRGYPPTVTGKPLAPRLGRRHRVTDETNGEGSRW